MVSASRAKWQWDREEKANFYLVGWQFGQRQLLFSCRVLGACLPDSSEIGLPGAEAGENGKNKQKNNRRSPSLSLTLKGSLSQPWPVKEAFLGSLLSLVQSWSYFELLLQSVWYHLSSEMSACQLLRAGCPGPSAALSGWYCILTVTETPAFLFKLLYPIHFLTVAWYTHFSTGQARTVFVNQPITPECGRPIVSEEQVQLTRPAPENVSAAEGWEDSHWVIAEAPIQLRRLWSSGTCTGWAALTSS